MHLDHEGHRPGVEHQRIDLGTLTTHATNARMDTQVKKSRTFRVALAILTEN